MGNVAALSLPSFFSLPSKVSGVDYEATSALYIGSGRKEKRKNKNKNNASAVFLLVCIAIAIMNATASTACETHIGVQQPRSLTARSLLLIWQYTRVKRASIEKSQVFVLWYHRPKQPRRMKSSSRGVVKQVDIVKFLQIFCLLNVIAAQLNLSADGHHWRPDILSPTAWYALVGVEENPGPGLPKKKTKGSIAQFVSSSMESATLGDSPPRNADESPERRKVPMRMQSPDRSQREDAVQVPMAIEDDPVVHEVAGIQTRLSTGALTRQAVVRRPMTADEISNKVARLRVKESITVSWNNPAFCKDDSELWTWHGVVIAKYKNERWYACIRYQSEGANVFRYLPPEDDIHIYEIKKESSKTTREAPQLVQPELHSATANITPTNMNEFLSAKRATRNTLPRFLWGAWATVVKDVTLQIVTASSKQTATLHMWNLLSLVHRFLPLCNKDKLVRHLAKKSQVPYASHTTKKANVTEDDMAIKSALKFINQGLTAKAAKALAPSIVADMSQPTIEAKARSKFPPQHRALSFNLPKRPGIIFMKDSVIASIQKMPNGASGGMSGWTKELLLAAINAEPAIAEHLGIIAGLLLSEAFEESIVQFCRSTMGVFLLKNPNTKKEDVRPVQVGCALIKLVGALSYEADSPSLPAWQKGIGTPKATTIIADKAQNYLDAGGAILTVDACNAFNMVSQSSAEHALAQKHLPHLHSHFRLFYYGPTTVYWRDSSKVWHNCQSVEGVRQGDCPSSYYYCLATCPLIEEAIQRTHEEHHLTDPKMQIDKEAYLDDLTLFHRDPLTLLAALRILNEKFESVGIKINWGKCELVLSNEPTMEIIKAAKTIGIELVCPGQVVRLLGVPVGKDSEQAKREFVLKKLECMEVFFKRASHHSLNAKVGYTLLRMCGVPKANFLCQNVSPTIMQMIPKLPQDDPMPKVDEPKSVYQILDSQLSMAIHRITGVPQDKVFVDAELLNLIQPFEVSGPLMYAKSHINNNAPREPQTVSQIPNPDQAYLSHVESCQGCHASAWMQFDEYAEMESQDFAYAMQIRHAHVPADIHWCTCSAPIPHSMEGIAHLMTCRHNTVTYNDRHEEVVSAINRYMKDRGFHTKHEPRNFQTDDTKKRPDLTISTSRMSPVIDVYIVTNFCPSHRKTPNVATVIAEEKIKKHAEEVEKEGDHIFFPFVIEASGHWEGRCDQFVNELANYLAISDRPVFRRQLHMLVSTAVQRGNARILASAIARIRKSRQFGRFIAH